MFWGMRSYEMALAAGLKFFVWGNLDYTLQKAGWDPKFRCGHYDGKGRVGGKFFFVTSCELPRQAITLCWLTPVIQSGFYSMRLHGWA